MTTDGQVRKLRRLLSLDDSLRSAARKTGMDEKTARKYRDSQCPSGRPAKPSAAWWLGHTVGGGGRLAGGAGAG